MPHRVLTVLAAFLASLVHLLVLHAPLGAQATASRGAARAATHAELVGFFEQWRRFEEAPRTAGGAPDYTRATNARRAHRISTFMTRVLRTPARTVLRSERTPTHGANPRNGASSRPTPAANANSTRKQKITASAP